MIDDDPDWPPPVCDPCRDGRHLDCEAIPWCECHFANCPPLPGDLP